MSETSPADATVLDALDDLVLVFDGAGGVRRWNRAVVDVTGYAADEIAEMTLADLFATGDAERMQNAVEQALETGDAVVEVTLRTADGRRLPHEFKTRRVADGDAEVCAGIGRDISERIRQRERIERREQVLHEMYEIIADRQRGFTEQVEALLALGRDELGTAYGTLSRIEGEEYVFEIVDADDDSIESGDVGSLSATNCERTARSEQTLVLGDVARDAPEETDRAGYTEWGISCYIGAPVFVDEGVYGTFCFYDTEPRDGTFSEWEVTLVDLMSRWVSYELQHQRATERLTEQNEKLERFAALVSHDLRNPLNVIEGSIELAEETDDFGELARARRAAERMNTLIEDLLLLARSGEAVDETEPVDMGSLAEECWEHVATEETALVVTAEGLIQADRTRVKQLLENLIRNAVEHGSTNRRSETADSVEHGSTSSRTQSDAAVEHGSTGGDAEHDERAVTITVGDLEGGFYVEDDGEGIPEAERKDVFESGYTTTPDGTGFGLAIVREIADAHGWDVRVTGSETGGARFEFTGCSP